MALIHNALLQNVECVQYILKKMNFIEMKPYVDEGLLEIRLDQRLRLHLVHIPFRFPMTQLFSPIGQQRDTHD